MATGDFSFEREWPDTAERLKAALERRRIPHAVVDDLVQETGLRLYQRWECVDPERGTWPLAFTVAMNILKDQLRSEVRRRAFSPPATTSEQDPEIVALARLELARVRRALDQLPASQRAALLAEVGEGADDARSTPAVKMLRMRARKRLRMLTREAPGALGSLDVFLQRVLDKVGSLPVLAGASACAPFAVGLVSIGVLATAPSAEAAEEVAFGRDAASSSAAVSVVGRFVDSVVPVVAGGAAGDLDRNVIAARTRPIAFRPGTAGEGGSDGGRHAQRGDEHGTATSEGDVQLPDAIQTLPPTHQGDGEPVTVNQQEASADPERGATVSAAASATAAGHDAEASVGVATHRKAADAGGWSVNPTVKGGAQLDGETLLELGR